jgi:tetratricopeptide (TPR) repeat protein
LTRPSPISRLLNKAIRIKNLDLLFQFRFFIKDIFDQLEKHQWLKPIRLYRSQILSNKQIQLLKDSIGKLLSINSFLSTNVSLKSSLSSLKQVNITDDLQGVIFQIDADPRDDGFKPFANITSLSYLKNEQEVIFMCGAIFRLENLYHDERQLIIIQITLCNSNEHELNPIKNIIRTKQNGEELDFISFGHILIDINKIDQAQKHFTRVIDELPHDHPDIITCYVALGNIAFQKGQYDLSLKWHQKCLEIKMRTLKFNDLSLASSHNSIALIYLQKNDSKRALDSYGMALTIFERTLNEDDPHIRACFNNMAVVYKTEKKYIEALNLYQKSLSINENYLSQDHPDLAMSHSNIGIVQAHLGHYDLALEHYNQALEIYEKILPNQHLLISMTLENIGNIHYDKGDFDQGLLHYLKAAAIYRHLLPCTHPDVLQIEMVIRRISSKLKYT